MRTKIVFSLFLLSALLLFPDGIMKLAEVKAGMQGEGRTIFKGTTAETFAFKVLGIIENFAPGKNLILVEIVSPEMRDGGIISGMSGSPVYIQDKLIGSVSYGFTFSRKPIAGVTPIEDILKTDEFNTPQFMIDISAIKMQFDKENVRRIADLLEAELARRCGYSPSKFFAPIRLIASSSGIRPEALGMFQPLFAPLQDVKLTPELTAKGIKETDFTVAPADAIAIPLVRGDFEYSVSGTVTHVDGKKVFIFGHPFFNLGTVDFPLHRAEVISVVPAYDSSFRLAATRDMVGSVQQDRFSAVQGVLGKAPYMIPVRVAVKNRNRQFKLEMVNHPLLTPGLTYITLRNIFMSEFQDFGFQTISVEGKIFIENEENVVISNLFSGTAAADDFSSLVLAINFFLLNNREKRIKIQKMDFEVQALESLRQVELENVTVEKNLYEPGELMNVGLTFRGERGQVTQDEVTLKAPSLKPGSYFYLMAADAQSVVDFDSKVFQGEFFPNRLALLIRAINNLRRNNRLYFKLYVPSEGFFVRGFEYPYLPYGLSNIINFNALSRDQGVISVSTIGEYQMEVPGMLSGRKIIKLKIKARQDEP